MGRARDLQAGAQTRVPRHRHPGSAAPWRRAGTSPSFSGSAGAHRLRRGKFRLPAPLGEEGAATPAPERPSALRGFRKDKRRRQKKKKWPDKRVDQIPFPPAPPPLNLRQPAGQWAPKAPGRQPWREKPFWLRDLEARRHKGRSEPKGPGKGKSKSKGKNKIK